MNIDNIDNDPITIKISKEQLRVICNALNEICNGIEVWEFETRIGVEIEDARKILSNLNSIYNNTNKLFEEQ